MVLVTLPVNAGNTFKFTVTVLSHILGPTLVNTSVPEGLDASYTVPFTVTLPPLQIVLVSLPVKAGNIFKLTVTVLSHILGPTLVNTSVPEGLDASYTVPFTVKLPPLQIVLVSLPVKAGNTFKLTVTVLSHMLGPTLVNTSVPDGLDALYTVPFTVTLPPLQIVLVSLPVNADNTVKLMVITESQVNTAGIVSE